MSKIAEALLKAKERTGTTTAPFLTPGPPGKPAVPTVDPAKERLLRKAQLTQRFWIVLLSVASLATLLVIWNRLKSEPPSAAPATPVALPLTSAPAASAPPSVSNPVSPAPLPVSLPPKSDPAAANAPTPPPAVAPRTDLYHAVNALVITAVLPGERPRLMYKGRIVAVGETVEGELIFAGIQDGQVVLNDGRGAIYVRRY